jgi:hypothetical protein
LESHCLESISQDEGTETSVSSLELEFIFVHIIISCNHSQCIEATRLGSVRVIRLCLDLSTVFSSSVPCALKMLQ